MHKRKYIITLSIFLTTAINTFSQIPAYKNDTIPVEDRIKDLLSRMTPEEKFWQLFMIPGDLDNVNDTIYKHGIFGFQVSDYSKKRDATQVLSYQVVDNILASTIKINQIQKYFIEKSRLGIPIIPFDEALHGLVRSNATVFPQAIALAATWDTSLMHRVAAAIAIETKARGIRQVLSPVVNIASDVRWGRVEETYGEDPFLASEMAVAYVSAFEANGIITTPKHFVANVGDGGRDSYPINLNERQLNEIYFPSFKAAIQRGGSRSIMTAYNSVNGVPASTNSWLLNKVLKTDWGFKGFVISDAAAVGGSVVLHNTAKDYPQSSEQAIAGGLDVIFQTDYDHAKLFDPPFLNRRIDEKRINDAVARVLRIKFEAGLFENPYMLGNEAGEIDFKKYRKIAREACIKSVILLKNNNRLLPLGNNIHSIALIGQDAKEARFGGYSGPGISPVSILDGLKKRVGRSVNVSFAQGCGIRSDEWAVIPQAYLANDLYEGNKGLKGQYYSNITLNGSPALVRSDLNIDFQWTFNSPGKGIINDFYSVRWTGKLLSPGSGHYKIGLEGDDGFRLFISNKMLINNWEKKSYSTKVVDYLFEKGKTYDIRIDFFESSGNGKIKLIWDAGILNDWEDKVRDAVAKVKKADVAIVVAGIHEGEFQDRASLALPGHQEEMIRSIAATGKPVVVLLVGGSAITMTSWIEKVNAIMDVWYPGEEGGNAIADLLFGDSNPSGRLPITFPLSEAQLPLVYNHKPTGRGNDYYNLSGLPLFPFGFGLSYTTFEYKDLHLDKNIIGKTDSTRVSFTVKNTGSREGDEVIQLYIRNTLSSYVKPILELKGFQRVSLAVGESQTCSFMINSNLLSSFNNEMESVVESGEYRIMIGSSSRNLQLKEMLIVK